MIQRQIKTRPEDVEKIKSGGIGKEILVRIKAQLEYHHSAPDQQARDLTAKGMLSNIGEWLLVYRDPATAATAKASKAKARIDAFRKEIETQFQQLQDVVPEIEYVADMRAKRFKWVSKESGAHTASTPGAGEVIAAGKLAKGEVDTFGASKGTGQEALALVQAYDLTEAEIMAIRVYSVGDYRTINPTLAVNEAWLKTSLPYVRGAQDLYKGSWLDPPGPKPRDPTQHAAWQLHKDTLDVVGAVWAAGLTPDDLSNIRAEARRHAHHAQTGLMKLPKSTDKTYRGEHLTPAEFKAMYPGIGHVRTESYFLSTSKKKKKAEMFATGAPAGKVGIMLECQLTGKNGRDIELLSVHRNEKEVLLLPGASLKIMDIKGPPTGKTYDHLVQLTEV